MCRMCVVLSAKTPSRLEPVLADKEVLLTTLNIKAMAFSVGDEENEEDDNDTQITNVSNASAAAKHRYYSKFFKVLQQFCGLCF